MAEQISEREIASVRLLTLEMSEGELAVLIACMKYMLAHTDEEQLEALTGAYRDEVEAICDDLSDFLGEIEPEAEPQPPVAEPA
jgi:hypothetical protein